MDKNNKVEIKQSNIFLSSEGDRWYQRNQNCLQDKASFFDVESLKKTLINFKEGINSICEIGCANGIKLNELCEFFSANGWGIDPSTQAVEMGNRLHKNIHLQVSTASNLPFNDSKFDLVFFGFCLYLIDRNDLYKCLSEADRIVKPGGFLAIVDFDPSQRHKNPYRHKEGVFSYKNSYANFLLAGGHYYLVAKESFSHNANYFSLDANERISITTLYKEPDPY